MRTVSVTGLSVLWAVAAGVLLPGTDKMGYSSLVTQEIKAAVSGQMQQRGYTQSDHPDLLVNFSGKLKKMQDIESTPVYDYPYYGYRAGFYRPWPGYAEDVHTVNYTEGTLNVDLIDAAREQMVWEGVRVGKVTPEQFHDRQAAINAAVSTLFAKFPFQAGQAQPLKAPDKS